MPYVGEGIISHYNTGYAVDTGKVQKEAERQGWVRANEDYPYMTMRDMQAVTNAATTVCNQWVGSYIKNPSTDSYYRDQIERYWKVWTEQLPDIKRKFISAFVRSYMEQVKRKDEEAAKRQPAPQPQPQQAYRPAPSPTGAVVTIKRADHRGDIHMYWLEVVDPAHLDEAYEVPEPLTVDYTEDLGDDAFSMGSAGGYVSAGDFVPPPPSTSGTRQAKRKPRIYWGRR